jgi:flavin prenyltransferase
MEPAQLNEYARRTYLDEDLAAPIASGSHPTRGMVIVPCSANTVARIALGLGDTLLARAAQVHLKERRPLIVVPRETPLSPILLHHMTRLAEWGVVILMAAPAYYTHPKSVEDMTNFVAGRALDHLGVAHRLYPRWKSRE